MSYLFVVAIYVVTALGYYKCLKSFGYQNAWMAWVPFANSYALADVAANGQQEINLIGTVKIPVILYKFWWAVTLVVSFFPIIGGLVALVIRVIVLGDIFIKLFSRLTYTKEEDQKAIGYISGLIPIVAAIKFLTMK
jgi:hypothetical protein